MTHETPADLVLRGGRVATMDAERAFAAAVAVRDGRIVAVGADDAVRDWIGPRTRVVELRGRSVTPGFGDAHVHPVSAGIGRCAATCRPRAVWIPISDHRDYAATHPDEPWIRGDGWSMADFPGGIPAPRRPGPRLAGPAGLPREPRRPHGLGQLEGARAGRRTADTPDPADGRIERDADGRPSGALQEGATTSSTTCSRGHARRTRRRPAAGPGRAPRAGSPTGRTRASPPSQERSRTPRSPAAAS